MQPPFLLPIYVIIFFKIGICKGYDGKKSNFSFDGCDVYNLVNPNKIADCKIFKSDLQLIFGMLQCKQNKNSLQNYMNENSEYFSCVDNDTAYAISALLQSEKWLNKILDEDKGEAKNMCQALQELYEEGVNQGIEKGIEEGILRGQASAIIEMVVMFRDMSFTDEMIVDKLISYFHMDEEAAANYL